MSKDGARRKSSRTSSSAQNSMRRVRKVSPWARTRLLVSVTPCRLRIHSRTASHALERLQSIRKALWTTTTWARPSSTTLQCLHPCLRLHFHTPDNLLHSKSISRPRAKCTSTTFPHVGIQQSRLSVITKHHPLSVAIQPTAGFSKTTLRAIGSPSLRSQLRFHSSIIPTMDLSVRRTSPPFR